MLPLRFYAIGLMKDELGGKVMAEFAALIPEILSYLIYDSHKNNKARGKIGVNQLEN